ncbi:AzlD domain-containing protein [Intrasporangium calvum]|uniref:AzlD domain-containing protein n=1 Tax=Intrasporangium calvum TaxID=53358 RepID=A0ABT5GDR0_9MICO|nr:AzlD domain-containing protein [Intrasporangium calvum]MDC5695821.1 AzlD domain-containing protein [Intrasporangium calvum]
MTMWVALLIATAIAFGLKLAGYLVPADLLAEPHVKRVTAALPIALLAALVAIQTLTGAGGAWTLDARLAAVGVAIVALLFRAPFIVVVVLGAATAALLRLAGWS